MSKSSSINRQLTLDFDGDASASPDEAPGVTETHPHPVGPEAATMSDAALPELADKTVYVVDAFALLFQIFHALPEMTSPQGQPVGCVFGFTRDLLYLVDEKKPDYLFVAFDAPGDTFRRALYEPYKADRGEMPDSMRDQLPNVRRMVEALGIPQLMVAEQEADDLLATVARQSERLKAHCVLVTNDKDCRQLISDRVRLYNVRKDDYFDAEGLAADWGIRPDQVVDFQALVGDAIDNVPGVPLIGPKLAGELLRKYDHIEGIYAHLDEIAGDRRRQNLKEHEETVRLSRQLVRLRDDVPVVLDWEAARTGRWDAGRIAELGREFGFRSLVARFASDADSPEKVARRLEVRIPGTLDELAAVCSTWGPNPALGLRALGNRDAPTGEACRGLALRWGESAAAFVSPDLLGPQTSLETPGQPIAAAASPLGRVLEDAAIPKVGHDLKRDITLLRQAGIGLKGLACDTLIAGYLLDAGSRNHGLDELTRRYLNESLQTPSRYAELHWVDGPPPAGEDAVVIAQAIAEADAALRMRGIIEQELESFGCTRVFREIEMPLIEILASMEGLGIGVDANRLRELATTFHVELSSLEAEIHGLAEETFNINAPKQLARVLFDRLQLPVIKKTKTGPSTDADVLEALAEQHPLPRKIVRYRQLAKLLNTYVEALPSLIQPTTHTVHTTFHQAVAATGRLSSADPNLQNIPVRTEEGHRIRSAFVPRNPQWRLVAADYSQIELRVLAHYSQDASLVAAFRADEDIHARVASEVFQVPLEAVTAAQRRTAKTVNFGVLYGQSAFGLANSLGIPQEEAAAFIEGYFARYSGLAEFIENLLDECRSAGYVRTLWGRRRVIPGVRPREKRDWRQRNLQERTAINTVIQGSAADLIKGAMIRVWEALQREHSSARMLLQIHDELLFETPSADVAGLSVLARHEMESVAELRVPLKVDVKAGDNWAACEPLEPGPSRGPEE